MVSLGPQNESYRLTLIAAIVALAALAVLAIVTLTIFGVGYNSTPAITTILGFVVPTIVALLALLQGERVRNELNGQIPKVVQASDKIDVRLQQVERTVTHLDETVQTKVVE